MGCWSGLASNIGGGRVGRGSNTGGSSIGGGSGVAGKNWGMKGEPVKGASSITSAG